MHSIKYKTFIIHFNGDYSGDCVINNISKDELPDDFIQIRIPTEELHLTLKQSLSLNNPEIELVGLDDETKEAISFNVNTDEILDFFIEKRKKELIFEIESMENEEFLNKYDLFSK